MTKGSENARPTAQAREYRDLEANKRTIRKRLRQSRNALTASRVAALSHDICRNVENMPHFRQARIIGLYQPVDNEADPSLLFSSARKTGKTVLLPVIDRQNRRLWFAPHRSDGPLRSGPFGILEPDVTVGGKACVPLLEIDILFLPMVGFDPQGNRLGFGGGFFDRTLADLRTSAPVMALKKPLLVGLAYDFQRISALSRAPHDVPVHLVVTEKEVLSCTV